MKKLLFLILFLISSISGFAQVVDDSALDKLQAGSYNFVEGMFIAYLADTVSPGFVHMYFQKANIKILDESIEPLLIALVNTPSEKSLEKLLGHKAIRSSYKTTLADETKSLRQNLENSSLSGKEKNAILKRMNPEAETYLIELNYHINKKALKEMMKEFRDVAYKIIRDNPRTVTLQADPGKEPFLMDRVEQLYFVKSTAMIAAIKQ